MLTSPNQAPQEMPASQPAPMPQASGQMPATEPSAEEGMSNKIEMLDAHINSLPPELQTQFEEGFRKYDDLPELFGMLMPDAYEYFKLIQQGVRGQSQQPTQNSPAASPSAPPAGEQAQAPLLGSAEPPAKATSAFAGMA